MACCTITLADSALTAGETTTVTFAFSESVTGLDASDINLSNANGTLLGPLTPNANRTVWTAIADGGPFDADGQANGVITAPGAAARMPLSLVGQTPDAAGGLWF